MEEFFKLSLNHIVYIFILRIVFLFFCFLLYHTVSTIYPFLAFSLFSVLLFSFQINLALSVIYSRHLIARLLGSWPEGHMITSEVLDNSDEVQLIGLLDILQRLESKERFEQVANSIKEML